jgi:uncharacterized protein with GYD domain
MPTYVGLLHWTDAGERNIKDSVERIDGTREALQSMGVSLREVYWTHGAFDVIVIVEAPNDETVWAAILSIRGAGYFRGETLRAFDEQEMQQVIQKMT